MKYTLKGLDCANCASKIERELRKVDGMDNVSISFATLSVDINPAYEGAAQAVISKMDPGVVLTKTQDTEQAKGSSNPGYLRPLLLIMLSGLLLVSALVTDIFGFYILAYMIVGWKIVYDGIRNLIRGRAMDENFLMTVSTVGAFAIRQYPEAVAVMLFYSLGEYLQDLAVRRSRRSIMSLMDLRPDSANLQISGGIEIVHPDEVPVGAIVLVRPGEKVPLDGRVIEGVSFLDTSALTGESTPRRVDSGDDVYAGTINGGGLLKVEVTRELRESSVSRILDLVQNAASRKAKTELYITRAARYYTPAVVFGAVAAAVIPPALGLGTFSEWLYRSLVLLVISCPCALVISIPLSYFGGIGGASRRGILIKGANHLESLTKVKTVAFDKTGTLTKGVFTVSDIRPAKDWSEPELLDLAAKVESFSNHPIGQSIITAANYRNGAAGSAKDDDNEVTDYEEIRGLGITARVGGRRVAVGSLKLLQQETDESVLVQTESVSKGGSTVFVSVDGALAGWITISDTLKPSAKESIKRLRSAGIEKIAMLTGDARAAASHIACELGIGEDDYRAELMPEDKVSYVEALSANASDGSVAFVGDGINDSPVLVRADVGIAMGALGSDAAIESADIVLMDDDPAKVAEAIDIARFTKSVVTQNIWLALIVKGIFLAMGLFGIATVWEAVIGDVGVALVAVLNAMRTLNRQRPELV